MRYAIDKTLLKEFNIEGMLTLESPLSDLKIDPKLPLYNGWQISEPLRKIVFNRSLSEIASKLYETPMVRLGYALLTANLDAYKIVRHCCLQGALGALVIDLENPETVTFYNTTRPITTETLSLVIIYCSEQVIFRDNKRDPFFEKVKDEGKEFGDHLQTDHHPFLFK